MNNACPQCGVVYAVAEKDVGRRIACKKCSTVLVVGEGGLKRDENSSAAARGEELPERDDDRSSRKRNRAENEDDRGRRRRKTQVEDDDDRPNRSRRRDDDEDSGGRAGPGVGAIFKGIRKAADVATWLYAFGLILTIYAFFAQQIDKARIASREGDAEQAKIDEEAEQREFDQRSDGKPSEDERKRREKNRKEYEKSTAPRLVERVSLAKANAKQSEWWNVMYKLFGYSLLAFGSIGYLIGAHSNFKRILGGATILLILLQVIGGGAGLALHFGGQSGG